MVRTTSPTVVDGAFVSPSTVDTVHVPKGLIVSPGKGPSGPLLVMPPQNIQLTSHGGAGQSFHTYLGARAQRRVCMYEAIYIYMHAS